MRGDDLRHVVRAVSRIIADQGEAAATIVVIGSQAIHASYRDTALSDAMTRSVEADVIVLTTNPADVDPFALLVEGAIGEESPFVARQNCRPSAAAARHRSSNDRPASDALKPSELP